jgi:hypothetical protein
VLGLLSTIFFWGHHNNVHNNLTFKGDIHGLWGVM